MPTAASTRTSSSGPATAELTVSRTADGRSVVRRMRGDPPLGLRELYRPGPPNAPVRVALLARAATLIGGDDVRLSVHVEDGAALELLEISATLAQGRGTARQALELTVGEGARLVFAEQPLIVVAGARLERRLTLTLAAGARALHRDTLVLGRHGEDPGDAELRLRVERAGMPLLDETIATGDLATLRSAAVAGAARAIASLGRYGVDDAAPRGAFAIGPLDTLVRRVAVASGELRSLDELQASWTAALLGPAAAQR